MTTYFSTTQAAKRLKVSRYTIWMWIKKGDLPATRGGPRQTSPYRISLEAIEALEARLQQPA